MALHAPQQLNFVVVEVAELAQALQVAFRHLMPALAAGWGLAGLGAVKNRVDGRGGGGEILDPIALGEAVRTVAVRAVHAQALPVRSRT